ncbi:ABC transporter ATP-binding protein [Paradesulfitobacterium ferrireducens]|uniref:ABC transporter ATP-binding protein n=1 Tax=Paradesulfitobacterium ferrireducens TaxID=2816476 RepID=UPI001A8F0852|nr:ABC transporter ATP-binding protein [Paradesulfitobacterium ferrireducens]
MILSLAAVETFIGQFHILQDINLEVPEGGVTVILGRNGAGKTTTLRTIMGLTPPSRGSITYRGKSIKGLPPYAIARKGIGFIPEDQGIFTDLTVEENLLLSTRKKDDETKSRWHMVMDIFPDLKEKLKQKSGGLSGGQKQMLAIARTLLNDNQLLLIDEPSKGLAPIVVARLADVIRELKKHTTVVLVEQNFALALAVGERYIIIDDGSTVKSGVMSELGKNKELQRRYLGITAPSHGGKVV